jgi:two-component system sensor histidine kinase NreB
METKTCMRILILEDNPFDVLLVKELLQNELSDPEFYCTNNLQGYLEGLDSFSPDIVLSDNCLPQFTASDALGILRNRSNEIPFILLTGSVSEKVAMEMIEKGANDFILKDRMARLPMVIDAACRQKKSTSQVVDYRYALNQAAIVVITDRKGAITYVNENCCNSSGYNTDEIINNNHFIQNAGYQHAGLKNDLWSTIQKGIAWQGEFLNFNKDGAPYWVETIIIPFNDDNNEPCQYVAVSNDITERKKLEIALINQQKNEQQKLATVALAAQENERNIIGRELHDNVNQLLVATKLLLSLMIQRTGGEDDLLQQCNQNIFIAIEENRKIASVLASPDFETDTLPEQLGKLTESMLTITGLKIDIDTRFFSESLLTKDIKLAAYRILQEQCTNIVKHAFAANVYITLQTTSGIFKMIIADDGQGIKSKKETTGVGLKNILGRVASFNGTADTHSSPGCGFTLEIEIPLP